MKFALVNGQKKEAAKGERGKCPVCDSVLVAKCGNIRSHHWAHERKDHCDHWWESETDWHREWKNHFPAEWQEIVQHSDSGEKHIADVKTGEEWVIEFQHSAIDPEELRSRNEFYKRLVWVVSGLRLKRDLKEFEKALSDTASATRHPDFRFVRDIGSCGILKKWAECNAPVFYDFGKINQSGEHVIWLQNPLPNSGLLLMQSPQMAFVAAHLNGRFSLLLEQVVRTGAHVLGLRQPARTQVNWVPIARRGRVPDKNMKRFMRHDNR